MPVRQLFQMQNNFRQRTPNDEGICTVTALQWAKKCLQLNRGIGSYVELGLSDHQRNALMAVWRRYDNQPTQQTAGMGLRIVGTDRRVNGLRVMQGIVANTAPHVAIFWNSFHTMGYRVGRNNSEFEWFDNNHGLYLANNADELFQTMNAYMAAHYRETVQGVRVVQI